MPIPIGHLECAVPKTGVSFFEDTPFGVGLEGNQKESIAIWGAPYLILKQTHMAVGQT